MTSKGKSEMEKQTRKDKIRAMDKDDGNVRVLTCFSQQEGIKQKENAPSPMREGEENQWCIETNQIEGEEDAEMHGGNALRGCCGRL